MEYGLCEAVRRVLGCGHVPPAERCGSQMSVRYRAAIPLTKPRINPRPRGLCPKTPQQGRIEASAGPGAVSKMRASDKLLILSVYL